MSPRASADRLRGAIAIGSRRTALQDLRFLIDELVEIAAGALSPGVNDPFTVNTYLDWLGAALADLAGREMSSPLRADDDDILRVIAAPTTFPGFVDRAFGALAQYAAADMIAGLRFLNVMSDVGLACGTPSRGSVLREQAAAFKELANGALSGANRAAVLARADTLIFDLSR